VSQMVRPVKGVVEQGTGFFTGVGFLFRGLGMYARSPRLMFLGLIPAVISFVLLIGALAAMLYFVDDVVAWITPFADNWSDALRGGFRLLAMIGIVAAWVILSILLFAALTLLIGQPFYEAISKRVEDRLGGVPNEIDVSFWKTLPRTVVDSIRLAILAAVFAVMVFLIGLIPVVGAIVGPVVGATLGGWVLALELTGVPFERRGLRYRDRKHMLKQRRPMAIGFGAATFICFLIPLGAVLVMPAAVAGATLLARRLFNLPDAEA
jgi:CysZ protein